jgi:hypothetical protein
MYDDFECTLDQWISILHVSSLYKLMRVRARAIREIDDDRHKAELDPVRRIVLANEYEVSAWREPAYEALCQREWGPTYDEAEMLGLSFTNKLWQAREAMRRPEGPGKYVLGALEPQIPPPPSSDLVEPGALEPQMPPPPSPDLVGPAPADEDVLPGPALRKKAAGKRKKV